VVLHGGPGFNHAYLVPHLQRLAVGRSLVFFDQHDGDSNELNPGVSAEMIFCKAGEVLDRFASADRLRVIAHSWGTIVLLGALRQRPHLRLSGLLISPVPTNRDRFDQMRINLLSRFGPELAQGLATFEDGKLQGPTIEPFLSHYVSRQETRLPGLSFDISVYRQVLESLGSFNFSAALPQISNCHILHGADDFTTLDLISDLVSNCASMTLMPETGHFPFAEQPEDFIERAQRLL